jgi:F0F1-type ATP synthase membrane subunit b/b'
MDEIRRSPIQSGLNELEKIFQEYKSKLEHAEQEANEIIDIAWQKAETIIASKQKEADQIADDIRQKAQQEADRIIFESKNKASEIERESTEKNRKEAKERTKREVERIIDDTRQTAEKQAAETIDLSKKEAESIVKRAKESVQAQVFEKSEAVIAEAKEKAKKVDEDSIARAEETNKLISEVLQKADDIFNRFKTQVQAEITDLSLKLDRARNSLEMRSILDENNGDDHDMASTISRYEGRQELNIVPPYDRSQIKKLVEALKQIPSVKLDGEAGTEDNFSIYLNISKPIPLHNILQALSLVESSDPRGDTIKLKLRSNNNNDGEW